MSEQMLSSEYIQQGLNYLLYSESVIVDARAVFRESISPQLMREALDEIMADADYFRVRLVRQGDDFFLTENREPCLLYEGNEERKIPEETNGYLFYVHYEDCILTITLHHFLCDGHGALRFLTELSAAYCRRRYGTAIKPHPLRSDPMFDWESLVKAQPEPQKRPELFVDPAQLPFSDIHNTILTVDKKTALHCAADKWQVMPFPFLLTTFCEAMTQQDRSEKIVYSFLMDYRRTVGCPDALYNCVSLCRNLFCGQGSREDLIRQTDAYIRRGFDRSYSEESIVKDMQPFVEISQAKTSWKIKQRISDMCFASTIGHVLFSYMGNVFSPSQKALESFVESVQVWRHRESLQQVPAVPVIIEEVSLCGKMFFCITYRTAYRGVLDRWKAILTEEGISVGEQPQQDII